jgi:sorbitol/mannitol transport system substrate-binding protein
MHGHFKSCLLARPRHVLLLCFASLILLLSRNVRAQTTLTIATVNNTDMVTMQALSKQFEHEHPDIHLTWVTLEENILREKTTTDVATHGGQFDVVTIGALETPVWGQRGWLLALNDRLAPGYGVDDLLKPIRDAASFAGNSMLCRFTQRAH